MKKTILLLAAILFSTFIFSQKIKLSNNYYRLFKKNTATINKTLYERGWENSPKTIPLNLFSQIPTSSYQMWFIGEAKVKLFIFNSYNNTEKAEFQDNFIYKNILKEKVDMNNIETRKYIFQAQLQGEEIILVLKIKS